MAVAGAVTFGVCVPTVREDAIRDFISAWSPHWLDTQASPFAVHLFVHEDTPGKTFNLHAPAGLRLVHTAQDDIAPALGANDWIIPRRSGACRSFPMYLAWKRGCDYIVTMDDDCYPDSDGGSRFLQGHLDSFRRDRWFRTIAGDEPRGIPYQHLGQLAV